MSKGESLKASSLPRNQENELDTTTILRAMVDSGTHLTLEIEFNALPAIALIDSGAIGIFMHPQFARECQAIV